MENKSNTMRLVIMAFLIALEIILTRFCSINTPILQNRLRIPSGCYDGDNVRSIVGCRRICHRRSSGNADLPIRSVLPRVHPDSFY